MSTIKTPDTSAPAIVLYTDSISHRIARLVHDHPKELFTRGQLLAAADRKVAKDEVLTAIPSPSEVTTDKGRSATVQLDKLLRSGLLIRVKGEGARARVDGSAIEQWLYGAGPVPLKRVRLMAASALRPEKMSAKVRAAKAATTC